MNKLNKLFIIAMIIGIFLIASALYSPNPLVVALTGYFPFVGTKKEFKALEKRAKKE